MRKLSLVRTVIVSLRVEVHVRDKSVRARIYQRRLRAESLSFPSKKIDDSYLHGVIAKVGQL